MTLSTGLRLGPYEILSPLGAGGMGEVYRARDSKLDRDVALKVLPSHLGQDPVARERFEREAKAVAALSHPNILSIFDFGSHEGVAYAVTELLEGETLRERLSVGALPTRKAVEYAVAMAQGLAAAHEKGIVHRDLKPENVFVTRDGRVKLLDFGLARLVPRLDSASGSERPDRGRLDRARRDPRDRRLHVARAGAGRRRPTTARTSSPSARSSTRCSRAGGPFSATRRVETMMAILREEPPELREGSRTLPPELVEIVTHCLEKNPDERFQSARDLAFALRFGERDDRSSGVAGAGRFREPGASIAVLPFRNVSADRDADYFSDGMTEEILSALSQIPSLAVAARTSSFAYKGRDTDVRTIGRELGVRTVLEGSIRQAGQRLRVTAQLIDVGTGYHLWSDRFDREMQDVFAVQDEIARAIAETLKVRLLGAAEAPLVAPTTQDVEAYNHYLKGRYFWSRRQTRQAIEQFEAAVARDPGYAAAYTGIADSYAVWGFYGGIPTWEAFARARAAAERAQELAPGTAGVHLSHGIIEHYYGWDIAREQRELRLAIEQDPRSFEGVLLADALHLGSSTVSTRPWRSRGAGSTSSPTPPTRRRRWAGPTPARGRYARGVAGIREGRGPRSRGGLSALVPRLRTAAGRAARRGDRDARARGRRDGAAALLRARAATAARSWREAGRRTPARSWRSLRDRATRTYVPPFDIAFLLAALGEREEALVGARAGLRGAKRPDLVSHAQADVRPAARRAALQAIADRLARTAPMRKGGGW